MAGKYDGCIRTSQPSCPDHQRSTQSCGVLVEGYDFLVTNSICFSPSAALSCSDCEQYWLELIVWLSGLTSLTADSLQISPYIQHHLFLDQDRPLVWLVVVHFACPLVSSIPCFCSVSTFHYLPQFVLKMELFML